jgi:hypothetical protein
MKQSTILALIPFLAGVNSLTTHQKPARFDVMAVSDGPVQYRALATSATFFWLGKGDGWTDSHCPPNVEKAGRCPPGKDTILKDAHTLVTYSPPSSAPLTTSLTVIGHRRTRPDYLCRF